MNRLKLTLVCVSSMVLAAACGGGSDGAAGQCGEIEPCGGDVVGTWAFAEQCVLSIDDQDCGVTLDEDNTVQTGTVTINADGTYSQTSTISGDITITFPAECFMGQITDCSMIDDPMIPRTCTGDATVSCTCTSTLNDSSDTTGTYVTSGTTISTDGSDPDGYCVDGDVLSITVIDGEFESDTVFDRQ